jgi:uncharacterized Rmd1/YagE family protein
MVHGFHAIAFAENFTLKDLAPSLGGVRRPGRDLSASTGEGARWVYPFGVVVFQDTGAAGREHALDQLRLARSGQTTTRILSEDFAVREDPAAQPEVVDGLLVVDRLTPARASVVALTVAQSAAMEYYETLVDQMFGRTSALVTQLRERGTVSMRTRGLHRFIGQAVTTRNEVLSVLHLLDKPDDVWDDPAMDRIYDELRAEFDLVDRYQALELKLKSVQEALELVLDVARDRRLLLLEIAIVALIVLEIVLSLARVH